jgi:hypothetical protein
MNSIKFIKIKPDGNCFYGVLCKFPLNNKDFYKYLKEYIINWIEKNYDLFQAFFGDDDPVEITKEEMAKKELNGLKNKVHD